MIQIIKASKLTQKQYEQARELHALAQAYDGFSTQFYWNSTAERQSNDITDLMFYLDEKLVGYVAIYEFETHSAEVCAVVHPDHRHKHVFSRLFDEAQIEMRVSGILFCDVVCHPQSVFGLKSLKQMGANYRTTEYEMATFNKLEIKEPRADIKIKRATPDDFKLLALLGSECFESSIEAEIERLQSTVSDKARSIYIVFLNDIPVGKVHSIKRDEIFLHDFCILPAFQGQGITAVFLKKVTNRFFQYGANCVTLAITADNPKALAMYRKCGFQERESQEYWRHILVPMPSQNEVIH